MVHNLFLAIQAWWLTEAAGPQLLFSIRIASGTLAFVTLALSLWNAISPNEFEHTWDDDDIRKFKVISWIKVLGCALAVLYFWSAAVFEAERTSSPHRLLINNVWASTYFLGGIMDALAWRFHYFRKRMLLSDQGENVRVKQ